MHLLSSLLRCPICKTRASSAQGCCETCQTQLFQPEKQPHTLTLGPYSGKLELAVKAFKFQHVTALSRVFSLRLAAEVVQCGWRVEVVCAVPLHLKRRLERGYNQSALIAKGVAKQLDVPYRPLVSRVRATRQQARLSREERLENVMDAFQVRSRVRVPSSVLLIDDVITSGATTQACVVALKQAGARQVFVAAVARAPLKP